MLLEAPLPLATENATNFHLLPKGLLGEPSYVHCHIFSCCSNGLYPQSQQRDATEGADIIMVKPSLPYLDIIADAAELTPDHPIACYQVSGEFAMIHAGAAAGVYDLKTMAFETTESMVRAGATLILSYFTPEFLEWL